jgi:hypothetical protein
VGLAVVVGGVLVTGYTTFRIWQRGTTDETRPVDAIVVLARIPQLLGPKGTRNGLAEHETGFGPGHTSRHD